jgi:hypothetical protein
VENRIWLAGWLTSLSIQNRDRLPWRAEELLDGGKFVLSVLAVLAVLANRPRLTWDSFMDSRRSVETWVLREQVVPEAMTDGRELTGFMH